MAKLEVFVSHRTVEAKFADALRSQLTRDFIGIIKFYISTDITSVPAGSQWHEGLLSALQRTHLMLVLCSSQSVKLPWINYEIGGACTRNVDVIPLCHSGMTPDHLPMPLSMSEGVVLSNPDDLAKLYSRVAAMIGSDVPKVDFAALSEEFRALEDEYSVQLQQEAAATGAADGTAIVRDPRVMCVSSQQYLEMGLANELQTVLEAFPKDLRHDVVTTSQELKEILQTQQVDVVHIAAFVSPRSGTLYFSRVELPVGRPSKDNEDFIRADALAMLLERSGTDLVVIASGDSLALATVLLRLAHVIAPRDMISTKSMARWVRTFYASLRTATLAEACEFASAQSNAPMKLLTRQVASPVKMTWEPDGAASGT